MAFLTDPSIALQVKSPNLAQVYLQAQQIRNGQQEQQMRSLSLAQATQAMKDEADVRAAYSSPDPVAALKQTNPKAAAGLQVQLDKQAADKAKATGEQRKLDLENNLKKVQGLGQLAGAATPQNWAQVKQTAVSQFGADPNAIPDQFDPNVVKQYQQQAMTAEQQITAALQQQKEEETAKHNRIAETTAAATQEETAKYHDAEIKNQRANVGLRGAELNLQRQKFANDTGDSPEGAGLVDSIGTGKIAVDRLGYLVSKNPGLLEAVSKKYPDFDSTKAGAYVNAYKDFTSTKSGSAGGALNAGGTALGHLKELKDMNTVASHVPGTPAYNAYMNKVDTVASELAKFYGDSTVSGIAAIRKTLASTLPGTRDAAIATQAQSMGDKFDAYQQSWENAAPSKAYQAPLPGISQKAIEARAALDPKFHAEQVQKIASKQVQVTDPNGGVHTFPDQAAADKFKKLAGIQ